MRGSQVTFQIFNKNFFMSKIERLNLDSWEYSLLEKINKIIYDHNFDKKEFNIFLTGGNSIKPFYDFLGQQNSFKKLKNTNFFFSDERFISHKRKESNYYMASNSLFKYGIPETCNIFKIEVEGFTPSKAALNYSSIVPKEINLMIFSLGEGVHIGLLFTFSNTLKEKRKLFLKSKCEFHPHQRIAASPVLIKKANFSFLIAIGKKKENIMIKMEKNIKNIKKYPANIINNCSWISVS